jgi:hypothetical protein
MGEMREPIPLCGKDFLHFPYMQASQANIEALYRTEVWVKSSCLPYATNAPPISHKIAVASFLLITQPAAAVAPAAAVVALVRAQ